VDRLAAVGAVCVAAAGLLLAVGCRDHPRDRTVGEVRVVHGVSGSSAVLRACLRRYAVELHPTSATRVVERDGRLGGSLTIADRHSPWLWGCDLTPGATRICGGSVGSWRGRRLNDPRLSIVGCHDPKGRMLGSAWVMPLPAAHSIAVRDGDHTDVYPVAGGLPVRIWTHHVVVARSGAIFDVSQLDADGGELSHERLRTFVAG
jgi:hypothetical protein